MNRIDLHAIALLLITWPFLILGFDMYDPKAEFFGIHNIISAIAFLQANAPLLFGSNKTKTNTIFVITTNFLLLLAIPLVHTDLSYHNILNTIGLSLLIACIPAILIGILYIIAPKPQVDLENKNTEV